MSEEKPKHPLLVEKYSGSLEELALDIKNMRYDKVAEFLGYLAAQFKEEADKDSTNQKIKLGSKLYSASEYIFRSQEEIDSAWNICKRYMNKK
ncbi:MAG: hypothetical protein Q8R47_00700 [Nanoarchaeota archaeon]|nr:hypothetical protein [Nanoarchaeota archaeon]